MSYRNDPDMGAIPVVGEGSVDLGRRTQVGEAVTYDGSEVDALIAFLGDDMLVNFDGQLYRKTAEGQLHPVEKPRARIVVVKPPAGEWFMITDVELKQEYAIHVNAPFKSEAAVGEHHPLSGGSVSVDEHNVITRHSPDLATAKKIAAKAAPKKKAPAKAAAKK